MTKRVISTLKAGIATSQKTDLAGGFEALLEIYASKLEQRVAEEAQNFLLMADAIPQIIWTTLADGTPDYFNQRWYEYTGVDPQLGPNRAWNVTHPDDMEGIMKAWKQALDTGEPFQYENRFRDRNGNYRWFLGRGIPGRDSQGRIVKWYGSCTDIDDHKKAQAKKDEFIAIASHELKTPVTSIKTFTQIMERRALRNGQTEMQGMLSKMNNQITKLSGLIDSLLDVSKIDSGKLELHTATFDFDDFVVELVENLQLISERHTIELVGMTGKSVTADKDRIEQVVINFVSNAIKYSPRADRIVVYIEANDSEVRLSVEDFGVGLDPAHHGLVFDRFYRVSGPQSGTFPGLGLGLFISKEIIDRAGGWLWVESTNSGTIFGFALPCTSDDVLNMA